MGSHLQGKGCYAVTLGEIALFSSIPGRPCLTNALPQSLLGTISVLILGRA